MLSLGDFYILHAPLAEEVKRLLPLPATVSFATVAPDGSLHPLQARSTNTMNANLAQLPIFSDPRIVDDRLILPLELPSKECVAVVISDVDPALLRKMSSSWLREMRTTLLQELQLVHWGYIDPEAELYNRRAAMVYLQEPPFGHPGFFLLLNTVFYRRTAAGNLQKLREIADLLQVLTQAHCFSFGYGVFGLLLPVESREEALKTAHYLQHQLKREGLSRVQIGFAQVTECENQAAPNVFEKFWRSLTIAEKRGPFGLCDIDAIDERLPHPFQLAQSKLLGKLKEHWRGLSRFTLVMLSRQLAVGQPAVGTEVLAGAFVDVGLYIGEEDNLALILLPEIEPGNVGQHLASIRKKYRECCGDDQIVALGVASWPWLDFTKSDIPGNCLKALLHSSYLGPGTTVIFDHLSLNVSGDFFFEEGDYRAAIREYRRGLRLQPGDLNLLNSLGVTLVECGQERQAATCFQEALAKEPLNYMALVNLGHVQLTLGLRELALECFVQAYLVLDQATAAPQELLLSLGKLYAEFGDHAKALAVFEHWLTCSGSEKEFILHRLLGQSYLENGQPEEAIKACQRALQLFPQDSISLSTLGLLYVEQGEGDDVGLTLCRKALALDNFNPDHWCRLSRALLHIGDHSGALGAVRQCLQLRRSHVEGLLLMGRICLLRKWKKRAERCFLQAVAAKGCTEPQAVLARKSLAALVIS
jgi:tetratricopeptide (TPR) repeat protein